MKIVLAFEGVDGSGKSSLAAFTKRLCERYGQRFTLVGRREAYATPLVGRFTRLLHDEVATLTPQADSLTRIAREYQRARLAAETPSGVVVFDRFVLSILALVRFHGQDVDPVLLLLKDLVARAHLHATVFVTCPFEVAWDRVEERSQSLPPRRPKNERMLRRVAELMEEDFGRGTLTGQQWLVDNSLEPEVAEEQLTDFLLPYLQKGVELRPARTPDSSDDVEKKSAGAG
jgi:thymidylate kinase